MDRFVRVATLEELRAAGRLVVQADGYTLVLFLDGERVFAVDNRCPHMGFPLHRGTLKDGILTCHWHHARFDLHSGGTFDRWADDVRTFPVEVRNGEVWVDVTPRGDVRAHQRERLREGLEYDIPLVIAKAVVTLLETGDDPDEAFRIGLDFGVRHRKAGWGSGLTILTCLRNLLPVLDREDRARALYHGLAAVAADTFEQAPRFEVRPLPTTGASLSALKQWYRRFIEVRDAEGAERCVVSALRTGATPAQMADLLLAAATDHRYLNDGHVVDFTVKALEALDHAGWAGAEMVLTSVVGACAGAERMEESSAWRHPVDLVAILEETFERLPDALWAQATAGDGAVPWEGGPALVDVLLGEDPQAIADALLAALREGAGPEAVAATVTYAAALRLARFPTTNEFTDWTTALHTFSFANAVQQALRRVRSPELVRGVFDAAMSVYLDRFLNVPPAPLPAPADSGTPEAPEALLAALRAALDRQQQVQEAGTLVARYLYGGGDPARLLATLGNLLLRENRIFHAIQAVDAAVRQFQALGPTAQGVHTLVAAARFLAAHSPTTRSEQQTFQIAYRLHRGERLYAEPDRVLLTVLFIDIVRSTEVAAELGDRRWRDVLRNFQTLVRNELGRHGGREVDLAGDGVLATFDSPGRAIRCALAVAAAVRRWGIAVRAGVHTGEVEVSGDRVTGIAVHVGARAAAAAAPGEVLVTGTVRDLVAGSDIRFEDRGTHTLRGVPGPWHLFAARADHAGRRG
jgi:class 3 adenylate cyclase/nitrite reductase/ring-hydroxylating ferredoxin subunit